MNRKPPSQDILDLLRSSVRKIQVDAAGKPQISGFKRIHAVDTACYILAYRVPIPAFPHHDTEKFGFIRGVLFEMAKRNSTAWKTFVNIVEEKRRAYLAKPIQRYRALFLTNIGSHPSDWKKPPAPVSPPGVQFAFIRITDLAEPVQQQVLRDSRRVSAPTIRPDLGWIADASVEARDPLTAFSAAYDAFEHFRTALNMAVLFGRQIDFLGATSRPMTKYLPAPAYFLFDAAAAPAGGPWHHTSPLEWRTERLSNDVLSVARKFLRDMRKETGTVRGTLTSASVMYIQALDLLEPAQKFLGVWQVIELLGRVHPGKMKDTEVIQRVRGMLRPNSTSRSVLDAVYEKRNRLVHDGAMHLIGNEDINWVRTIAESCMNFYAGIRSRFRTMEELDIYFQLRETGDSRLRANARVASHLLRQRKPK